MSSSTHTADFQTATVKANDLDAVAKINVGLETDQDRKHLNIVADAPEIRIQDKTGSAPEVNATTMAIVADGGATHFRAGTTTFAEGAETKGNVKFQSSTGATTHAEIVGSSGKLELQDGGLGLKLGSNVSVTGTSKVIQEITGPHDRPLTKYPEVVLSESSVGATTHTSQGYTISSSSTRSVNTSQLSHAFNDFDNTNGNLAWTSDNGYSTSTGLPTSGDGDYIQIFLPGSGIKLDHTTILSSNQTSWNNPPRDVIIYGSNDGVNWTTLNISTDLPLNPTQGEPLTATVHVGASTYYRYFRLRVTKTYIASGNSTYTKVAKWSLYGYEEGDVSTDVTLSSVYNKPGTEHLEVYWDANDTSSYAGSGTTVTDLSGNGVTGTLSGAGFDSTYNAFTFDGSNDTITTTYPSSAGDNTFSASMWVKRNSNSGTMCPFILGDAASGEGIGMDIYSSGDVYWFIFGGRRFHFTGVTDAWFPVGVWTHVAASHTAGTDFANLNKVWINGVDVGVGHDPHGGNAVNLSLDANDTLTLGARVNNNYLNGSIANFRIFSKALSASQVKELYDWQKDYFLGSRSSMTLYQGNLGLGVAAPTSRLEIAGNERIQEYPPRAMTGSDTYMEGHGVFKARWANWYSGNTPWGMYNKTLGGGQTNVWYGPYDAQWGGNGTYYNEGWVYRGTDFAAWTNTGLFLDDVNGNRYHGAWTTLEMPYDILLQRIHLYQGDSSENVNTRCAPEDGVILGSANGHEWHHVHTFTGLQYGGTLGSYSFDAAGESVLVNATTPYRHYALVTTRTLHYNFTVIIGELKWFGTPASTTLDDGLLTLGKTLTTPRVSGHAAGAETPRAESLHVHYDTTVDSVVSGTTVVDTSGNGINSVMENGLVYSSSDRALVFNGTSHRTYRSSVKNESGAWVHSISLWCKSNSAANDDTDTFFFIGEKSSYKCIGLEIQLNGNIRYYFWSSDGDTPTGSFTRGVWHHVAVTYDGGSSTTSKSVYIDGVKQTLTQSAGTTALNINANDEFLLGCQQGGSKPLKGSISNFKIWSGVVLTAEEVAMEYALGRTGKALNVTDTAVCIGGIAPRAQLDVRGSMIVNDVVRQLNKPFFTCAPYANGSPKAVGGTYTLYKYDASQALVTTTLTGAHRWRLHSVSLDNYLYGSRNVELVRVLDDTTSETSGVRVPYEGVYVLAQTARTLTSIPGVTFWVYSLSESKYIQLSDKDYNVPWSGGNVSGNHISNGVTTMVYLKAGDTVIFVHANGNYAHGTWEQHVSLAML